MSSDYAEGFRAGAEAMRKLLVAETDAMAVFCIDVQAAHTQRTDDVLEYWKIHQMMLDNAVALTERLYSTPTPRPPLSRVA